MKHVRANPLDITSDEVRDYRFLSGLFNIPKYGPDPDVMWKRGERNGQYSIEHHAHHQGNSRSGKTHYWYNWFDVLDHSTGMTFQVSHFLDSNGKSHQGAATTKTSLKQTRRFPMVGKLTPDDIVTASRVPALMGLSPYTTPNELLKEAIEAATGNRPSGSHRTRRCASAICWSP